MVGGSWNLEFRGITDVLLDIDGNVYVLDTSKTRIRKYAPGVPGWKQRNLNGFGDRFTNTIVNEIWL